MATLNTYVPVWDDAGTSHLFAPGVEIPEWAAEKITNPHVWVVENSTESDADRLAAEDAEKARLEHEAAEAARLAAEAELANSNLLPVPPKGGPKATAEVWAAYAQQEIAARGLSIDIPADAGRNDIIEALTSANIPTGE